MTGPNYWPAQPGPAPRVPVQQAPARRTGLPAWAGILAALALIAGGWFGAGAIVSPDAQAATGGKSPVSPSATPPATGSGQAVSTATRPPQSARTYPDPLPQALQPAGNPKVTSLSTYSKGDFSGRFDGQTAATYAAWVKKLKAAGFTPSAGKKNDSTNFDLSKGHIRILGDYLAGADEGHSSITFVYDEAGA
ncbi:hypothetical protein ABIB25_004893 [Nakamurella sp. UYEF19]|uniref:hypothetical protein n=1 Tax=Nakamurella sp. UYEF19 TaxID=1756392 RepID=UPI0033939ABF